MRAAPTEREQDGKKGQNGKMNQSTSRACLWESQVRNAISTIHTSDDMECFTLEKKISRNINGLRRALKSEMMKQQNEL